MMRKNTYKALLLCLLIALSIIQTISLWLSDTLGHNFMQKNEALVFNTIHPESVWVNSGGAYTKAYRIANEKSEYEHLVKALQRVFLSNEALEDIEFEREKDWAEIFNQKGLVYKYSVPITINEIAGKSIAPAYTYPIDTVFLSLAEADLTKANVYLINEVGDYYIRIGLHENFSDFVKIFGIFNYENNTGGITQYQPSVLDLKSSFIEGNVFLANISSTSPLTYTPITFNKVLVENNRGSLILENYIDEFFEKSIMKEKEILNDGTIIYTEPMKSFVRYSPQGVLHYVNLDSYTEIRPMSRYEAYDIVQNFIDTTQAIPQSIREHLYLSDITTNETAYTFHFDIMYGEHKVILQNNLQSQLGLEHFMSLTIKDFQLVEAKWLFCDLVPVSSSLKEEINEPYASPIDKMYGQLKGLGIEYPVFGAVECVYKFDKIGEPLTMLWGVTYQDKWFYP